MISVWQKESWYRDTDVLIAGGGLMGLWTAYELIKQKPGLKVTICEAQPVPALASTRNAGFACFGSPSEVWHDLQLMGEDPVWEVVEMRFRGIAKIREIVGDAVIDYDAGGGFELFLDDAHWTGSALNEKLSILNQGFQRITGIDRMYHDCTGKMGSFGLSGFSAMAGNTVEGGLHSGKLVMALQQMVRQMGAVYLEGHSVCISSNNDDPSWEVRLAHQDYTVRIKSPLVVWATNAFLGKLEQLQQEVKPARGQVLLSPPVPGLTLRGTFHFDEGFYYFRNLGNRLLLGGARNLAFEDEETFEDQPTEIIGRALKKFIGDHFPQAAPLLNEAGWMHWAGIMGMSKTKKPLVREIAPGQWAALACNGMGVALTPMVAEWIAREVLQAH